MQLKSDKTEVEALKQIIDNNTFEISRLHSFIDGLDRRIQLLE